jgi:dipeptidyl aminopeptidase/acylaminoacyl peptidase
MPEWEGHSGTPEASSAVQAVAIASTPADFLSPGGAIRIDEDSPVTRLFGGTVDTHRDAMWRGSPVNCVHADAPPFLIAHGTLDETVPFEHGLLLYRELVEQGAAAEFVPIEGVYHNWMTTPDALPGREDTWKIGAIALPFLKRHLHPAAA